MTSTDRKLALNDPKDDPTIPLFGDHRNTEYPGAPYTEADSGKEEDVNTPTGTSSYLESLAGPVLTWMEVKDFAALNAVPREIV